MTLITAGVVPFAGEKISHGGAGVPGCPPSAATENDAGVVVVEDTVTDWTPGTVPPAIAEKDKLRGEICRAADAFVTLTPTNT